MLISVAGKCGLACCVRDVWYGTLRKQFNCQTGFTLPRTFKTWGGFLPFQAQHFYSSPSPPFSLPVPPVESPPDGVCLRAPDGLSPSDG